MLKKLRRLLFAVEKPKYAILLLLAVNLLAWYPALNFWFFRAWEHSWLMGVCGGVFDLFCFLRSHGFLYVLNYKLFGWNPTGWYLTALILHLLAVVLSYEVVKIVTKNNQIAFIAALLFGVNVTYNDVVNWGSFEGLYALLMVVFLLSVITFNKFKEGKAKSKIFWYLLTLALLVFAVFLREVGLLLPFFILFYDLFKEKFKISKGYLIRTSGIFLPFGLISVAYIFFREWYGGSPNDYIDAMVQLRFTLVSQGKYPEYFWRAFLAFGRFAAAHPIPYQIVNWARDVSENVLRVAYTQKYFFVLAGWLYVALKLFIIKKDWKTKTRNALLFSFLWFFIPTLFFSFAWSITDDMLVQAFGWNASRWRYFAFFGTVVFWVIYFWGYYQTLKGKRKEKLGRWLATGVVVVFALNFFFLRLVQKDLAKNIFGPERQFFTQLTREFETLPEDYIFYAYPYSSPLGDYLSEWYYMREVYYPELDENRINLFGGGYMPMLLDRFVAGTANLESTFFLDYNVKDGLINRTKEAKELIAGLTDYSYAPKKTIYPENIEDLDAEGDHQLVLSLDPQLHVEFPYEIQIDLNRQPAGVSYTPEFSRDHSAALEVYSQERVRLKKRTTVDVCATAPAGSEGKPAINLIKEHLVDGNISSRSLWVADCRPSWVVLDLGQTEAIAAIAFSSIKVSPSTPADYTVEVSRDAENWSEVLAIRGNKEAEKIHPLAQTAQARYLRFTALTTLQGGMLTLAELEPISEKGASALSFYGDRYTQMVKDSRNFGATFIRFSWETKPDNDVVDESLINKSFYMPLEGYGTKTLTINPNEGDFYSVTGQFLERMITAINIDATGLPSGVYISSVRIKPRVTLD